MRSNDPSDVRLVLVNMPDPDSARTMAHLLVTQRLAACVNLLPGVTSVYRWNDAVECAEEVTLLIKTTAAAWPALERQVRQSHPYDVPEILQLPVSAGYAPYLSWVVSETISSQP